MLPTPYGNDCAKEFTMTCVRRAGTFQPQDQLYFQQGRCFEFHGLNGTVAQSFSKSACFLCVYPYFIYRMSFLS